MMRTVEVRWFLPMDPPKRPALFPDETVPATRTDWYARSHPGCGIKLREGNLDVKLLERDLGIRDLGGIHGRVEQWRKWIYEAGEGPTPRMEDLAPTGWIAVQKTRSLLPFSMDGDEPRQVELWPETGCQFEWTEVTVARERLLTIGFEAFGDEAQLESNLIKTTSVVLPQLPEVLPFHVAASLSYSRWLETIVRPAGN